MVEEMGNGLFYYYAIYQIICYYLMISLANKYLFNSRVRVIEIHTHCVRKRIFLIFFHTVGLRSDKDYQCNNNCIPFPSSFTFE